MIDFDRLRFLFPAALAARVPLGVLSIICNASSSSLSLSDESDELCTWVDWLEDVQEI